MFSVAGITIVIVRKLNFHLELNIERSHITYKCSFISKWGGSQTHTVHLGQVIPVTQQIQICSCCTHRSLTEWIIHTLRKGSCRAWRNWCFIYSAGLFIGPTFTCYLAVVTWDSMPSNLLVMFISQFFYFLFIRRIWRTLIIMLITLYVEIFDTSR